MQRLLESHELMHRLTSPGCPFQNGVTKRMKKTLFDIVRVKVFHRNLSKEFWAEALSVAAYIRSRVTTRGLSATTSPFELMFGNKPYLSYIRVFGCRCFYTKNYSSMNKLDSRSSDAIMMPSIAERGTLKFVFIIIVKC